MKIKTNLFLLALIVISSFVSSSAISQQLQQFQHSFNIDNKYPAAMIIVGESWHEQPINNLLREIEFKANELFMRISLTNGNSEIANLGRAKKGEYEVKPEVANALRSALTIASWSKGAFDITNGNYKKIEVAKNKPMVKLQADNLKIDLTPIIEGLISDYMISLAKAANANNAVAKVGTTFRSMGVSDNGPWKIQIQDSEGTFAHHAMNLTLKDAGVSSNSIRKFDKFPHLSDIQKQSQCKGVVVIAREAAIAQGVAFAVFKTGPVKGVELINDIPNVRGLVVDLNGRFYRSNNF